MPRRQRPPDDVPASSGPAGPGSGQANSAETSLGAAQPEPKVRGDLARIMTNDGRTLYIQQQTVLDDAGAVDLAADEQEVVLRLDVPATAVSLALALSNRMAYLGQMSEASVAMKRTAMVMQQLDNYSPHQLCDLAKATAVLGSQKLTSLVHSTLMCRLLEAPGLYGSPGLGSLMADAAAKQAANHTASTADSVTTNTTSDVRPSYVGAAASAVGSAAGGMPTPPLDRLSACAVPPPALGAAAAAPSPKTTDTMSHEDSTNAALSALDDVLQHAVSKGVLSPQLAATATSTASSNALSLSAARQTKLTLQADTSNTAEKAPMGGAGGGTVQLGPTSTDALMLDSLRKLQEAREHATTTDMLNATHEYMLGEGVSGGVDADLDADFWGGADSPHHHDHLLSVFSHGSDVSDIIRSAAAERDITPPDDELEESAEIDAGGTLGSELVPATEEKSPQTTPATAAAPPPRRSGLYGECPPGSDPLAWRIAQHVEMERVLGPLELPNLDDLLYRPMGGIAARGGEGDSGDDAGAAGSSAYQLADAARGATENTKPKRRGGKRRGGKNKSAAGGGAEEGAAGATGVAIIGEQAGRPNGHVGRPAGQFDPEFPLRGAELRAALARGDVSLHDAQVEALFHPSRYEGSS